MGAGVNRVTATFRRLGRRGAVLTILGGIWTLIGVNVLAVGYDPTPALLSVTPSLRGALWVATGIAAALFAWRPQGQDAPGFLALYVMVAYRCVAYIVDIATGRTTAAVGLLAWLGIAALILIVSGWREAGDDLSGDRS